MTKKVTISAGDDHNLDQTTAGENGHFISKNGHFKDSDKQGLLKFGLIVDQILSKRADKVTETKVSPSDLKTKFEGGFTDLKDIQFGTENIRDSGQITDIVNKNLAKKSQSVISVTPKVKCEPPPRLPHQKIPGIEPLRNTSSNGQDLPTDSLTHTGSLTATSLDREKVIYLNLNKKRPTNGQDQRQRWGMSALKRVTEIVAARPKFLKELQA